MSRFSGVIWQCFVLSSKHERQSELAVLSGRAVGAAAAFSGSAEEKAAHNLPGIQFALFIFLSFTELFSSWGCTLHFTKL